MVRESVPTELLTDKEVWEALLEKMPITAMIRNLGNMSKNELLVAQSDAEKLVYKTMQMSIFNWELNLVLDWVLSLVGV